MFFFTCNVAWLHKQTVNDYLLSYINWVCGTLKHLTLVKECVQNDDNIENITRIERFDLYY